MEIQTDTIGTPVALAGPGPHSPVAARRAAEFTTIEGTTPTLLNVQPPVETGDTDPVTRGQAAIKWVADRAGLEPEEYDAEVVVSDDVESAIIDAVTDYNTVCVGLSEKRDTSRILFGSIAERISQTSSGNVSIVRGLENKNGHETREHHEVVREGSKLGK